jgi:Transposase IS116/IS110/IS902 family
VEAALQVFEGMSHGAGFWMPVNTMTPFSLKAMSRLLAMARQLTTGGKPRLVGISKRGNIYLRKLLIHGARAALPRLAQSPTLLGGWLRGLIARMHKNAVVVALANKLARIAWAVLQRQQAFGVAVTATA